MVGSADSYWRAFEKKEILKIIKNSKGGAVLNLNIKSSNILKDPVIARAAEEKNIKLK